MQAKPLERDIQVGELTGYRTWRLVQDVPQGLCSIYAAYIWKKDSNRARCYPRVFGPMASIMPQENKKSIQWEDLEPDHWLSHTCGFYAMKLPESTASIGANDVVGEVEMWGQVIESTHGYRAEYMRVSALYEDKSLGVAPGQLEAIAEFYDVPIVHLRELV